MSWAPTGCHPAPPSSPRHRCCLPSPWTCRFWTLHVNGTVDTQLLVATCGRSAACFGGVRQPGAVYQASAWQGDSPLWTDPILLAGRLSTDFRWLGTGGCRHLRPGSPLGCTSGGGVAGSFVCLLVSQRQSAIALVAEVVGRKATVSWGSGCLSRWGHREPLGVVGAGGNEAGAPGTPAAGQGSGSGGGGPCMLAGRGGGAGSREWRALSLKQQPGKELGVLSPLPRNPDSRASPSSSSCVGIAGMRAQTRTTGSERKDPPLECAEGPSPRGQSPSA